MFIKQLTLKAIIFNLLIMPVFVFAAIAPPSNINLKEIYNAIKPETYMKILNVCGKDDKNIESCLDKLQAQKSDKNVAQNNMSHNLCCKNVSGYWGDYAHIRGKNYCIPPCR